MKKHIIYYIAFALLLSACKVSKDVQLPDTKLPLTYRSAMISDTGGIARLPYRSFFTDKTLLVLLDSAVAGNYDLQVAVKNIEQAQLVFKQSKLGNLPTVSLSIAASSSRPSDNSLDGLSLNQYLGTKHIEDYTAAANISWEADIWGKIRSKKAAAYAGYLQTEEARKAVQTEIVSTVSQGYYNLLMLDAQLAIAHKNLNLNDSTLKIIKLQYAAGQVTSLAVQQAEAQQLSAAQLVPMFEQEIILQENAICILTGKLPDSFIRTTKLDEMAVATAFSAGVPSTLLSVRPDVRSAELEVAKSNAAVGIAKAQMYPTLTITAQGGVNAFKASNWFNIPASLFGTVLGGVVQPIFQHKELNTQYDITRIEREKSIIHFRQQVLVAVGEVSDALVRIDKLNQQQVIADNRATTLRKATSNAGMLFKNGMANYLEVITAQSNVLQSELELATIKKAQLSAIVDLYRSTGGGWQ